MTCDSSAANVVPCGRRSIPNSAWTTKEGTDEVNEIADALDCFGHCDWIGWARNCATVNERTSLRGTFQVHGPSNQNDDRKDRKSTRLNSSHQIISYAVFCLKKKKKKNE